MFDVHFRCSKNYVFFIWPTINNMDILNQLVGYQILIAYFLEVFDWLFVFAF